MRIEEEVITDKWNIVPKSYCVVPTHVDIWTQKNEDLVISLFREVVETDSGFEKVGYVEIQQSYNQIEEICRFDSQTEDTKIIVFDNKGSVIYPYGDEDDYRSLLNGNEQGKIFEFAHNTLKRGMAVYEELDNIGWYVLFVQDQNVFFRDIWAIIIRMLALFIVLICAVTIAIVAASKWISDPINQLAKEVENVTLENASGLKQAPATIKEIEVLKNSFIQMVEQLRESALRLSIAHESELRLKIEQLQAKINPHFLYNSLTAISLASCEGGNDLIEQMCFQLSELFRYVSEDEPEIVTLQEEMDHVKIYLSFMKFRYENNFQYECIANGNLADAQVRRLVFQPLVENCFQHGFTTIHQPFKIFTKCIVDENGWEFVVEDNGSGFDRDVLRKIHKKIMKIDHVFMTGNNYESLKANNMAIINVYIRLKFMYREKANFFIENDSQLGGARVSIVVKGDKNK